MPGDDAMPCVVAAFATHATMVGRRRWRRGRGGRNEDDDGMIVPRRRSSWDGYDDVWAEWEIDYAVATIDDDGPPTP